LGGGGGGGGGGKPIIVMIIFHRWFIYSDPATPVHRISVEAFCPDGGLRVKGVTP